MEKNKMGMMLCFEIAENTNVKAEGKYFNSNLPPPPPRNFAGRKCNAQVLDFLHSYSANKSVPPPPASSQ